MTLLHLSAQAALAADLPPLRAGMWEFVRTVEGGPGGKPGVLTTRRCANPAQDMAKQHEKLTQSGCAFSPTTRSGNVYRFSAQCKIQGVAGESRTALTVESDSAYTLRVESRFGPQATVETLKARRTGDCK